MQIFKGRPLCVIITFALILMAGCAFMPAAAGLVISLAAAGILLVFILLKRGDKHYSEYIMTAVVAALIITASGFRGHFYFSQPYSNEIFCFEEQVEVTAVVRENVYSNNYGSGLKLELINLDEYDLSDTVYCECSYPTDFETGDVISFTATVNTVETLVEEGFYNKLGVFAEGYKLYLKSYDDSVRFIDHNNSIRSYLESFNRKLCAEYLYYLGEDCGALASALALGNQSNVPGNMTRDFARSGLAHILALSGSHIILIIGSIDTLLYKRFFCGKRLRSVILILSVPLYVIFVMSPVPVIRAGIMYMLMCLAAFPRKDSDSITNLFLSVIIMAFIDPSYLFSVSMWMSFLATLALIVFMPPLSDKLSSVRQRVKHKRIFDFMRAILLSVVMCVLGSGANIIFSWATFGTFSTVSLIANVIFGPLLTILLVLFMLFLFAIPFPTIASAFAVPIKYLGELTLGGIERIASYKYSVVSLEHTFAAVICVLLFLIFIGFLVFKIKRKVIVLAPIAILVSAFTVGYVSFASSDSVDILFGVRSDNEYSVIAVGDDFSVIDISNGRYTNIVTAVEKAKEMGACELDSLVLSHYHRYHVSAVARIIEEETVRNLLVPEPLNEYDLEVQQRLSELCAEEEIPFIVYMNTNKTEIADSVYISNSPLERLSRSTHTLVSFSLDFKGETLTYVGASVNDGKIYESVYTTVSASDYVVFGRHGPIPKTRAEYEFLYSARVYVINENAYTALSEATCISASKNGQFAILFTDGINISAD